MRDLIRRYKKIFAVFSLIIISYLLFSLYLAFRYNFDNVVRYIVQETLDYNMDFDSALPVIKGVNVNNVVLRDRDNNIVLEVPRIRLEYSFGDIIRGYFISDLILENPKINLTIHDYYHTNITDALNINFDGGGGSFVPLRRVRVQNAKLNYEDVSYTDLIKKEVSGVNGEVNLDQGGVKLFFEGRGLNKGEKISFGLDTSGEGIKLRVAGEEVQIQDELLQYAYDDEGMIDYKGGKGSFDISWTPDGLFGYAKVEGSKVNYEEINSDIEQVGMEAYFHRRRINLYAVGKLKDNPIEFVLTKVNSNLDFNFKSKNLNSVDLLSNLKSLSSSEFAKNTKGIINYAEINLNLKYVMENEKERIKLRIDSYFRGDEVLYKENSIEDFRGEVSYDFDTETFNLKNVAFVGSLYEKEDFPIKSKVVLNGTYDFSKINLDYEIFNKNSFFRQETLAGNFFFDFDKKIMSIANDSEKLQLNVLWDEESGDIAIKCDVNDKVKINNKNYGMESSIDWKLDFDYNYKKRELRNAEGKISLKDGELFDSVDINLYEEDGVLHLDKFDIRKNDGSISFIGVFNPKNLSYKAKADFTNVKSSDIIKIKGYPGFEISGKVDFEGGEKDFISTYELDMKNLEYFLSLKNTKLKGTLSYLEGKLNGEMEGYSGELDYTPVNFKDLYIKLGIDNDKISIKHIKNRYLYIAGDYFYKKDDLNLNYSLDELNLSKLNMDIKGFEGKLGKLAGELKGNLSNPFVTVALSDSNISISETEKALISGNVSFEGHKLYLNQFKFKENVVSGTVDFVQKNLDLRINLLEPNLNSYYGDSNIKYIVMGQLNLWGPFDNIRAVSSVNISDIHYRGEKLPDFFAKFSYAGGNLYSPFETGKISLTSLELLGQNSDSLVEAVGYLDIKNRDFFFDLKKQEVPVKKMRYLIEDVAIEGSLVLSFNLKGKLGGDVSYNFDIESIGLSYKDVNIDSIKARVSGDDKKVHIDYINMKYDNNELTSKGEWDLESLEYDFFVNADKLELEVLNLFLLGKDIEVSGLADIDIVISNEKTEGSLKIQNASASLAKDSVKFTEINSLINLSKEGFKIENLDGKLNDGQFKVEGYYKLPELNEANFSDKAKFFSNYNFEITMDKVNYEYDSFMKFNFSCDFLYKKNSIVGELIVNEGEILKLPESKEEEEKPLTNAEKEKDAGILDDFYVKLNVNIKNGISINVDDIPLVEDIELIIEGGGITEIKNERVYFTGSLYSERGALTFNNNIFEVTSAVVVFDDASRYFPDVNPSIAVRSRTRIGTEDIYANLNGYYDSLELRLTSSSGLSEEDITSLLIFRTTLEDTTVMENVNEVVKDMLDRQISEQIFSPISKELERVLSVSKVRITSDFILNEEEALRVNNDLILGASIEIQDPLYKDKVYWNLKTEFSDQESGSVESFDLWLDYRINKTLSWKLGVERIEDPLADEDANNLHLGIDFKFDKESIFDLRD